MCAGGLGGQLVPTLAEGDPPSARVAACGVCGVCCAVVVLWLGQGGVYGLKGVVASAQVSVRSRALVVGQVDVTKHLLSATLAPRSAKYCLDRAMPLTAVAACFALLA